MPSNDEPLLSQYLAEIQTRFESVMLCEGASSAGTVTVKIPRLVNLKMTKALKWSLINENIRVQKYKNETLEITRSYFSKQGLL